MANGFVKYLKKEDHLHKQVMDFIRYQYPKVKVHHSPMEGKRSLFEQFKLKWLGADSGFPDIIIPAWRVAIEIKVKPNKPTEKQLEWINHLSDTGWTAEVCYDFESAKRLIKNEGYI